MEGFMTHIIFLSRIGYLNLKKISAIEIRLGFLFHFAVCAGNATTRNATFRVRYQSGLHR